MPSLESMLGCPSSPEEFHALVTKRLAHEAKAVRGQAHLIATKFPELKAETIRKADLALEGMLILPGTGAKPHFVGNPPRWFDHPFNDDEYVWTLNRMFHWMPLLRAFSLTGDQRYAPGLAHRPGIYAGNADVEAGRNCPGEFRDELFVGNRRGQDHGAYCICTLVPFALLKISGPALGPSSPAGGGT